MPARSAVVDILVNAAVQFDLIPPSSEAMLAFAAQLGGYPSPGDEPELAAGAFKPGAVLAVLDQYGEATPANTEVVTQLREAALMRMHQDARTRVADPGWPEGRPAYLDHPDYLAAVREPPRSVASMPTTED